MWHMHVGLSTLARACSQLCLPPRCHCILTQTGKKVYVSGLAPTEAGALEALACSLTKLLVSPTAMGASSFGGYPPCPSMSENRDLTKHFKSVSNMPFAAQRG